MYTKDSSTKNSINTHSRDIQRDLQQDFQRVKDKANETRAALQQTAYDVKDRANQALTRSLKDAKAKQLEVQDNIVTFVTENPVKSVGIALLTGLILAQIFRK